MKHIKTLKKEAENIILDCANECKQSVERIMRKGFTEFSIKQIEIKARIRENYFEGIETKEELNKRYKILSKELTSNIEPSNYDDFHIMVEQYNKLKERIEGKEDENKNEN